MKWENTTSVPDTFFPAATRLVTGGAVLGGCDQGGGELGAIQDQRAAIYFWDGKSASAVYEGPGGGGVVPAISPVAAGSIARRASDPPQG